MNGTKLKELLHLYVMGETNDEESVLVENHLLESDEYREEYEKLRKLHSTIANSKKYISDEKILIDSRRDLLEKIKAIKKEESWIIKIFSQFNTLLLGGYRPALSTALALFIGLLIGYLVFDSSFQSTFPQNNTVEVDLDNMKENGIDISNIRFKDPFTDEGEIVISFDAIKPISLKGDINDPQVQSLLAAALSNSDNPGLRIRTVNTLASGGGSVKDPKVKSALIRALKTDQNDGVRREALNALSNFPYDTEIRDAYLFALANDINPGIKVAAINALAELKLQGKSIDEELKNVIENDLKTGEDDFIKIRAASLIQEVK